MNNARRNAVLRSLWDFFFDLRRAIVVPPAIQSKKEQPRPIASEEARQSPNRDNRSGCKNTVRLLHLYSIKLAVSSECAVACTRHAGLCQKSSHSLKALYLLFRAQMAKQNSTVIYSAGACFSTSGSGFFGVLTAEVPDFYCKISLRRVYYDG